MTAEDMALWEAFYFIHPWGEAREDVRFAMLLAQQANMHRDEKKPPYPLDDFLPKYEEAAMKALLAGRQAAKAAKTTAADAIVPGSPQAMATLLKTMFPGPTGKSG